MNYSFKDARTTEVYDSVLIYRGRVEVNDGHQWAAENKQDSTHDGYDAVMVMPTGGDTHLDDMWVEVSTDLAITDREAFDLYSAYIAEGGE